MENTQSFMVICFHSSAFLKCKFFPTRSPLHKSDFYDQSKDHLSLVLSLSLSDLINQFFQSVVIRLLESCKKYVMNKKSNLTNWHPIIGWFSHKSDERYQFTLHTDILISCSINLTINTFHDRCLNLLSYMGIYILYQIK